jgi:glyoxylase-like metal-dependent hydrolase (beta-lactamase superfamily II)
VDIDDLSEPFRPGLASVKLSAMQRRTAFSEDWQEEVGWVEVDSADGRLHFDPLDPPSDADHTFVTVFFHARDARGRVWAPTRMVKRLANRGVEVTDPFEPGDELPGGVQCFETARDGEVVYWLPSERALVVGDVLLGAGAKPRPTDDPLRLCPERWLSGKATHDDLRASLRPLLELPVEQVLVSHGAPVPADGHARLAEILSP